MKFFKFNLTKLIAILICLMLCFDIYVCFERRHRLHKAHKYRHHRIHKSHKGGTKPVDPKDVPKPGEAKPEEAKPAEAKKAVAYTINTTNPIARLYIGVFEGILGNVDFLACISSDWVTTTKDVSSEGWIQKQINGLNPLLGTIYSYAKKVLGVVCLLISLGVGKLVTQVWNYFQGSKRKRKVFIEGKFVRRRRRRGEELISAMGFMNDLSAAFGSGTIYEGADKAIKADLARLEKISELKAIKEMSVSEASVKKLEDAFKKNNYNTNDTEEFKKIYLDGAKEEVVADYKTSMTEMRKIEEQLLTENIPALKTPPTGPLSQAYENTVSFFNDVNDYFTTKKEEKSVLETITEKMLVFGKQMSGVWTSDAMKKIKENYLSCAKSAGTAAVTIATFPTKVGLIMTAFASGVGIIPYLMILLKNIMCQLSSIEKLINYFVELIQSTETHARTYYFGLIIGTFLKILTSGSSDDVTALTTPTPKTRKFKKLRKYKK